MNESDHLIIFTRFPVPGEAKTRLIPALGADEAAELQRQMTEYTVAQARKTGVQIEIRWAGGDETQMREWLGDDLDYAEQGEGDLGDRMARAFENHFDAGAERVVLIGCDCPSNGWKNSNAAFLRLKNGAQAFNLSAGDRLSRNRQAGSLSYIGETSECVIGPAADGGYYLIGLSRVIPELFQQIDWGTEQVFEQTLEALPFAPVLLSELSDVDLPEDIPPKISVIIPTLNEANQILPTLGKVSEGFRVECIVVDGGSTDRTEQVVRKLSHFMTCETGRAAQQNAGAAKATGEIFLFLHADTELPDQWDWVIRDALKNPMVSLGAFRFGVKERILGIGAVEWGTNIRSSFFHRPYGDQGLFLRRETFEKIGRFPDQPIMEDVALVRCARRIGRIVTVSEMTLTSGRRWQKWGVFRTTLINQVVLFGAALGVSLRTLRRLYG